ncbi:MAG TPA: peptidylprolyl isomerase [Soehngenia sp.]|nr:peptidylprolyl isomerase [Soehngenia sp.]HPP31467.1 peptidylprolyl isomerase [Soehngenia sp.]
MKFNAKKLVVMLLLISMTSILLIGCSSSSSDEVVAEVNDVKITKEEFYDYLVSQNGDDAINALILDKIIELELKENNIDITQDQIDAEYQKAVESYGDEATMEQALAYYGYTKDEFLKNIKMNLSIEALIEPSITITDDEIAAYFEENKDDFNQAEQVKASHILLDTEEEAKDVLAKIQSGESFEDLAKEYSTDTATAANGGDLGYFGKDEMVEEFSNAAFALNVNEVSEPVKTTYGYHIIKVTDKKEAKAATLEDSKEEIREILKDQKIQEQYPTWYQNVQSKYTIKNNLKTN